MPTPMIALDLDGRPRPYPQGETRLWLYPHDSGAACQLVIAGT